MDGRRLNDGFAQSPRPELVRPWIWALLAAVLTLAIYLPALAGEFVWDDTALIAQTPRSGHFQGFVDYFTKPFWEPNSIAPQTSLYYRPLVALSYELDHGIHGLNSAGYRITNYSFHLANVVLLFLLARRFGASGASAGLLSATWGLLPRLSESVAWISGRTDVLAATFTLSALFLWENRWSRRALASICLVLGLFCKETALAGLVVLVFFELNERGREPRTLAPRLAVLAAPTIVWLILKSHVSGILPTGVEEHVLRVRVLMSLEAIGRYASMVLDWLRPRAEIGIMGKPSLPFAVAGVVVLTGVLAALALFWRRLSWVQRGFVAGAIAALLPVLHVVPLALSVNAADRFLYVPLALLTLLLAASARVLRSKVFHIGAAVVLLSAIPVTLSRAQSWADPVDLWTSEYKASAGACETCRIELAKLQAEAGDFIPALRMQNGLMRDTPGGRGVPDLVALNMSILYLRIGEYERARELLLRLVTIAPEVPRFWRELATAQAAVGHFADAEKSARRALALMPSYRNAQVAVELIRSLPERADRLKNPDLSDAERADALTAAGRAAEAEKLWQKVLESSSDAAELEGALSFMVNLGSSAAVTQTLAAHEALLQNSPDLAMKLRLKRDLHHRLVPLNALPTNPNALVPRSTKATTP